MLIDKSIVSILGGGYSVKEIKYKDLTVWNLNLNGYRFKLTTTAKDFRVYLNGVLLQDGVEKMMDINYDRVSFTITGSSNYNKLTCRVYLNGNLEINKSFNGYYARDRYNYSIVEGFNKSSFIKYKVNEIEIEI